jgi:hypothetical protein
MIVKEDKKALLKKNIMIVKEEKCNGRSQKYRDPECKILKTRIFSS